ncbi:MAG TPA: sulfotransferase [Burkholderiaceae bacterium]
MAALAQLMQPAQQSRMVFVVGAARSGTTALQAGLSASDQDFVLGEAFFFWENLRPGFRARHNAKHRGFGLPPSKLYDCPAVAPENGTWVDTFAALAARYRLIGDKLPFGGYKEGRWPSEFLAFHHRHFHGAAYILAFRNPRDAILSPRIAWGIQNLVPWARSYIAAQRALIRLRLNFPRTVPVFLETVGPDTFEAIEHCLGNPMPLLPSKVRRVEVAACDAEQIPPELRQTVEDLERLYPSLRDAVSAFGTTRPGSPLDSIDACLAQLYRRLEPLYYSVDARMARLHSKVVTASRMAKDLLRQTLR